MDFVSCKRKLSEYKIKFAGETGVGISRHYPFSLRFTFRGQRVHSVRVKVVVRTLPEEAVKALSSLLPEEAEAEVARPGNKSAGYVQTSLTERKEKERAEQVEKLEEAQEEAQDFADRIIHLISQTTAALAQGHAEAEEACVICGKGGCDAAVLSGSEYRFAHRSCVEALKAGQMTSEAGNGHGRGAIGAVLGLLIGMGIMIAAAAFGHANSALILLLPVFIYALYAAFGGRLDGGFAALLIALSMTGFLLAGPLCTMVETHYLAGVWPPAGQAFGFYYRTMWNSQRWNTVVSLVCLAIGIVSALISARKVSRLAPKKIETMKESLLMIRGHQGPSEEGRVDRQEGNQ